MYITAQAQPCSQAWTHMHTHTHTEINAKKEKKDLKGLPTRHATANFNLPQSMDLWVASSLTETSVQTKRCLAESLLYNVPEVGCCLIIASKSGQKQILWPDFSQGRGNTDRVSKYWTIQRPHGLGIQLSCISPIHTTLVKSRGRSRWSICPYGYRWTPTDLPAMPYWKRNQEATIDHGQLLES